MSFFSSIANFFKDPARVAAAASTFGGSEAARAIGGDVGQAVGTAFNPIGAATNKVAGLGGGGGPGTSPTPVPQGPPADITNFANYRKSGAQPGGVSFGANASSQQQRSQIATGATNAGLYNTPEIARYYRDLAVRSLTNEEGEATGSVLPIERQFLEQVFGVRPRNDSTASFLSALLRADGGMPAQSPTGIYMS